MALPNPLNLLRRPGVPRFEPRIVDAPLPPHELPEAQRRWACDRQFIPGARQLPTAPGVRAVVGPQARAMFGVYTDLGNRWRLEGFAKSPWSLVSRAYRIHLMRVGINRLGGVAATNHTLTFTDDTGVSRNYIFAQAQEGSTTFHRCFNQWLSTNNDNTRFKYGTGSTAATENDTNIQTQAGTTIDASTVAYDDTNKVVAASGSQLFVTGATALVSEIAQFQRIHWFDNTSGQDVAKNAYMLADRTILAANVLILNGQTAAVSYTWQF